MGAWGCRLGLCVFKLRAGGLRSRLKRVGQVGFQDGGIEGFRGISKVEVARFKTSFGFEGERAVVIFSKTRRESP